MGSFMYIEMIDDIDDVAKLLKFISDQPQQYPNFTEWVNGKLKHRVLSGQYKTMTLLSCGDVVGDVVYTIGDDIEIKNLRIDKQYHNRSFGRLLLSQLYTYNKRIITDITVSNFSAVEFFVRNGFRLLSMDNLYTDTQYEYTISKDIFRNELNNELVK